MQNLDLFDSSIYLYEKMDKIERSLDRKIHDLFYLIQDLSDQILELKKNSGKEKEF